MVTRPGTPGEESWFLYHGGARPRCPSPMPYNSFDSWLTPEEQQACQVHVLKAHGIRAMNPLLKAEEDDTAVRHRLRSWRRVCQDVPALARACPTAPRSGPWWFLQLQRWYQARQERVMWTLWAMKLDAGGQWGSVVRRARRPPSRRQIVCIP